MTTPEEWLDAVGPGWRPILERLFAKLRSLGWNEDVAQIKEKWGTLRVYVGEANPEIWDTIHLAEAESGGVCEDCGAVGKRRHGGWIRTLCDSCSDKFYSTEVWP